jgi:hypothetical protein
MSQAATSPRRGKDYMNPERLACFNQRLLAWKHELDKTFIQHDWTAGRDIFSSVSGIRERISSRSGSAQGKPAPTSGWIWR